VDEGTVVGVEAGAAGAGLAAFPEAVGVEPELEQAAATTPMQKTKAPPKMA
jgi:hypothetical protein